MTKPKKKKPQTWLTISLSQELKDDIRKFAKTEVEGVFKGNVSAFLNWFLSTGLAEYKRKQTTNQTP